VVTHRRRCGKATCRCAAGEQLHESTVLSYTEGGRTRLLMLPDADVADVAAVQAATARYQAGAGQDRSRRRSRSGRADQLAQAVNGRTTTDDTTDDMSDSTSDVADAFAGSRELFESLRGFLDGASAADVL